MYLGRAEWDSKTWRVHKKRTQRTDKRQTLTAVVVGGGKLGALVAAACAVAGLHLQLVPGGLTQLTEEELSSGVGLEALPSPRAFGPEVQHEVGDGAAAAGPALQVEPCVGGVDVGEQWLVLVKHWFCGEEEKKD